MARSPTELEQRPALPRSNQRLPGPGTPPAGGMLYLAFTPYHALLATAVASSGPSAEGTLAIIGDFDSDPMAEALLAWESTPFYAIYRLPGLHRLTGSIQVRIRQRRTTSLVGDLVSRNAFERVLVCNDSRPEGQRALHVASLTGSDTGCIEDGSAAYASTVRRWRIHEWIAGKIVFGRWWMPVEVHGRSPWSHELHALYPDLVRDELAELPVHEIPAAPLRSFATSAAFLQYIDRSAGGVPDPAVDVLMSLPHSDFLKDVRAYRRHARCVIDDLERTGAIVALKYHPREPNLGYMTESSGETRTLPNALPLEALYLHYGGSIRAVVGDLSTALISARWMLDPSVSVISMTEATGFRNARLIDVFRRLDISAARTPDDVVRAVESARRR